MNDVFHREDLLFVVTSLCIIFLLLFGSCAGTGGDEQSDQPIAFSHKIHAGDYQMPCLYCHMHAAESKVASVPPVKTCMGCHDLIGTDKPEVEKLAKFREDKQPIEWNKVYDLPDYVRFSHERHVEAGVVCGKCHGPVQEMTQVRKYSSLSMGWCLGCHREMNADIDCFICHH